MKGQVSGTVYSGEKDHSDLLNKAYAAYSLSNPALAILKLLHVTQPMQVLKKRVNAHIRLVRVGFGSNFEIDPKGVKKLITSNTIMIFSYHKVG